MQKDVARTGSDDPSSAERSETAERVERRAISSTEFSTALIHFYRGEITRANVWRQRLDATFNWAVLTTGTTLSFAYGSVDSPHVVILINSLLIAVFLFIEARRYRYYEVWSSRVRIIETDYFAPMLSPKVRSVTSRDAWSEHLAEDLLRPHFTVGLWEAVGRRLRRNYIWVFMLLALSWLIKIAIHPSPVSSTTEFLHRASLGSLPGWIVLSIVGIYNGLVFAIAFLTASLNAKDSEVSTHGFERSQPPRTTSAPRRRSRGPDPDTTATFEPITRRPSKRPTATLRPRDRD